MRGTRRWVGGGLMLAGVLGVGASGWAQGVVPRVLTTEQTAVAFGPFSGRFLPGGVGLVKPLHSNDPLGTAQANWSMSLWLKADEAGTTALLAGVGAMDEATPRYLALREGKAAFWSGGVGPGAHELVAPSPLTPGVWHAMAVSVDAAGMTHLVVDGAEVARAQMPLGPAAADVLEMAPVRPMPELGSMADVRHFGGLLALVSLRTAALTLDEMRAMGQPPAGLDALPFEDGSKEWPEQSRAGANGYKAPQDPATLPHSQAAPQAPVAVAPLSGTDEPAADGMRLVLRRGWQMADAAMVHARGEQISAAGFAMPSATAGAMDGWMAATVPGTALTTLVDRGVYPDPDFGLNNMAIPENLKSKSWWYRRELEVPAGMRGRRLTLRLEGINYHATVWVNGRRAGDVTGAFLHKGFDISALFHAGERNVVAIQVDAPPHPGIGHEQSLAAGAGDNGGVMMLDGPTFGATEGWDWIPAIRDRNTGLWQDVVLEAAGPLEAEVPQIITRLPGIEHGGTDRSRAELTVRVPVRNATGAAVRGSVSIAFDDVHVTKAVTFAAGATSVVELTPKEFSQLIIANPKLWWPNGYGAPALHTMHVEVKAAGRVSDRRDERFGIREMSYEISALDGAGKVRRVEMAPTVTELDGTGPIVTQSHAGFRETAEGWVTSFAPGMERSAGVQEMTDRRTEPDLVIRVNGVRIAARGGSWGMDDMMKRVSRERLEPFFRLHREGNVNIIRNWMGQNTEDVFFDLADEYGLMVWSDFWDSTQDWNLEPTDSGLFLENAKESISRYRNHPSIVVWCGRNEGVPPATINDGLARLIADEDGTRYYSADSNKINLHDSGPYLYQEPADYFTKLSLGFAVEVGLLSPPTRETWEAWLPKADQWPISDAWAYHDWHHGGNGDTAPWMNALVEEFGAPTSLADFDRKAQMLNYEGHRAAFEGMNAHLWAPNSGRLLWMTQPAWPSSNWQILSHDYDTQASFYGFKKAGEPIHVQMNLPGHEIAIVNNTEQPLVGAQLSVRVLDTDAKVLLERATAVSAGPNATTVAMPLELGPLMADAGTVLVRLELKDASGKLLSDNFYWQAATHAGYRRLETMAPATLTTGATTAAPGSSATERQVQVTLRNSGASVAIQTKLTLQDAATGKRILPAYYSDNYVSLLPGETRTVSIAYPAAAATGTVQIGVRGFNLAETTVPVQ